ncbi:hypothetical protein EYF80_043393 [Liparis tanakae]|uniref:Uncharacterized protein n=1 Tax=Liparis tanakae TaxID=230148 RepID=A0A4Z2G0N4_9TELE|nr:hypothetical protein EYF80_043393 [Liparis tanakae]
MMLMWPTVKMSLTPLLYGMSSCFKKDANRTLAGMLDLKTSVLASFIPAPLSSSSARCSSPLKLSLKETNGYFSTTDPSRSAPTGFLLLLFLLLPPATWSPTWRLVVIPSLCAVAQDACRCAPDQTWTAAERVRLRADEADRSPPAPGLRRGALRAARSAERARGRIADRTRGM